MTDQAKNEIEKLLLRAQAGEIDGTTFINQLMEEQIFMPIHEKHEIGGLQSNDKAQPLSIKDETGEEILILFTSPERAKNFVKDFPGYGGGLLAEFKWILEKMGTGFGISINPDHELGFDLEANMLSQLTGS